MPATSESPAVGRRRRAGLGFGCGLPLVLVGALTAGAEPRTPAKEIRVGMTAALSGPSASLGSDMRRGIEVYFERRNRSGGIGGHRLRLLARDDGYEPDTAERNMLQLIDEDDVLAVVGNVGTPTAERTVPIAIEKRTLLFGAFTGAAMLRRTPPDRYVINYRASYRQETAKMVRHLAGLGIPPNEIAFFSQADAYGDAGYEGAVTALEEMGFEAARQLAHGRYARNTTDIEEGLNVILGASVPPRAIIMVGAYTPCAKFIRIARKVLPNTLFLNVSFVGSEALAEALGPGVEGVIVTQVVPHPGSEVEVARRFRADLARLDRDARASFVALEGYIVAGLFAAGVEAALGAGGELNRESIVDGIESLRGLEVAPGAPVEFGPQRHQGSDTVWTTMLREGRFVPVDWRAVREFVWARGPIRY